MISQSRVARTWRGERHANDNAPAERRIVVSLDPSAPITRTEIEVFDVLIGRFDQFAANDNDNEPPPDPQPPAGHGCVPTSKNKNDAEEAGDPRMRKSH